MSRAAYRGKTILFLFLIASTFSTMIGCGGSTAITPSTPDPSIGSYYGTQSPGDAWSWTITRSSSTSTTGTFAGTNNTSGYTYAGTFTSLSSKFLQFTFTATTDPHIAVGNIAYAVELPGTALLVKPAGTQDSVVIAAAQGTCPSAATYNWIKVANLNWDINADPAFGTATITGNTSSLTFSVAPYLLGSQSPSSTITYSGSCSNAIVTAASSVDNATFATTPGGAFIGDQAQNGGVAGMLQPSAAIGTASLLQQGRQFRGFVFMTHPPYGPDGVTSQDKTQAIWSQTTTSSTICPSGVSTCVSAGEYTDNLASGGVPDTCPGGDSCASLAFTTEIAPGEFSGMMTDSHAGTHPFTLIVNQIDGKFMIFGISQNQAGSSQTALYPYLVLLMEQ